MNIRNSKGYVVLEATIIIPVFIIAISTLMLLINLIGAEERVMQIAEDEAYKLSVNTYYVNSSFGFESQTENRIKEEIPKIEEAELHHFGYLYEGYYSSDLISFDVTALYNSGFGKKDTFTVSVLARAWTGAASLNEAFSFDAMEIEGDENNVYVFPRSGTHYHRVGCTYVDNVKEERVLTYSLKEEYEPCERCESGDLKTGSLVYCFPAYGEKYHRADCDFVERYVTSMDEAQARDKGYEPCSKCCGM